MAAPEDMIEKRKASALFKGAKLGMAGRALFGMEGRAGIALAEKFLGGRWITGNVYLTPADLVFKPDFLDASFHKNSEELHAAIPLGEITQIDVRQGLATPIVDVNWPAGTFSFRCYRAKAFVAAVEDARGKLGA